MTDDGASCTCPCWVVVVDGVFYGPALPSAANAALLRLHCDQTFHAGPDLQLQQTLEVHERRPLSALQELYALPGDAIGDWPADLS